jgi:hypothetical protein
MVGRRGMAARPSSLGRPWPPRAITRARRRRRQQRSRAHKSHASSSRARARKLHKDARQRGRGVVPTPPGAACPRSRPPRTQPLTHGVQPPACIAPPLRRLHRRAQAKSCFGFRSLARSSALLKFPSALPLPPSVPQSDRDSASASAAAASAA